MPGRRRDNAVMACWCGNEMLADFGEGYRLCEACQTLVTNISAGQSDPRVHDDQIDLYGHDYWFSHQTGKLHLPDIIARSRTDLAERAIHWLRAILQFKLPPADVLEIGCSHGGFVAMLNQAGFAARGLELSPSIVKFAQDTFGIHVLTGPIEDQRLYAQSLDAIVMMDVMEHLPDPMGTLGQCGRLLKGDGILLIQTPEYPAGKNLSDLRAAGHKFPQMLDPGEHLFLFSQQSAVEICRRVGLGSIQFIPAIFGFYDMSFIASAGEIRRTAGADQNTALEQSTSGRMMRALLDSDARRLDLLEKYRKVSAEAR